MGTDFTLYTDIDSYLGRLKIKAQDLLIIISVKDTAGAWLRRVTAESILALGFKKSLYRQQGQSYIGVLDRGEVKYEALSARGETLIWRSRDIKDFQLYVRSSIYANENTSNIRVNGVEYSMNSRGLNIVVIDRSAGTIADSVCFDTHAKNNTCIRKAEKMYNAVYELEGNLRKLQNSVDVLTRQVEKLTESMLLQQSKTQMLLWEMHKREGESDRDMRLRFFRNMSPAEGPMRKIQEIGLALLKSFDRICRENGITYWLSFGNLLGAFRHGGFIPWDDDTDVCMLRPDFEKLKALLKDHPDFQAYNVYGASGAKPVKFNRLCKFRFRQMNTASTLDIFLFDEAPALDQETVDRINQIKKDMAGGASAISLCRNNAGTVAVTEKMDEFAECEDYFAPCRDRYLELLRQGKDPEKLVWAIDNLGFNNVNFNTLLGVKRQMPRELVFPLKEISFDGLTLYAPNQTETYLRMLYGDILSIPNDVFSHKHFDLEKIDDTAYQKIVDSFLYDQDNEA